ncbi:neuropeptide FF receptor 2 [Ceratitis capitata]|uniref:neuropeptide FF receptor 2 n=1 Tax=Ceratitis capitata TaxID=7213 RepID=UPI00061883CA|nr:neuropeptide FF receptor 2 [Ceratitis capitata]XP_020713355.1 neuropeptide FF receptor 2 [Ceratitis capitata]
MMAQPLNCPANVDMCTGYAMSAHTRRAATVWRRRKPATTVTMVILLINVASTALTLAAAAAVTLQTTERAALSNTNNNNNSRNGTLANITTIIVDANNGGDGDGAVNATSTQNIIQLKLPISLMATTIVPYPEQHQGTKVTNANNNNDVATDYEYEHRSDLINNKWIQVVFCIIYATVFALGIFGNVLVCYVVIRNRTMQTVTNIFITNLALSDILLCVLAVPFTPLYTFMGRWIFGEFLCHLVSFAQGCSIYLSTLTLTAIAVDRVFVIVFPFRPRMKLTTTIFILITIWILSIVFTLPYGLFMRIVITETYLRVANETTSIDTETTTNDTAILRIVTDNSSKEAYSEYAIATLATTVSNITDLALYTPKDSAKTALMPRGNAIYTTYCEENWPTEQFRRGYGFVTALFQFFVPLFIITCCYVWVSVKLNSRQRSKPGNKSVAREEADRERKKRTNYMLMAMVVVFAISWLPINVVNVIDDFYDKSNDWPFYTFIFFITHAIAMSSTCYNPFLYAWLNDTFRKEFKNVLPCFNPSAQRLSSSNRRCFNRSDRNTCGGTRHRDMGNGCGLGASMDLDDGDENDNGITQETSLARTKERDTSTTRTHAPCSNGSDAVKSHKSGDLVLVHKPHVADTALNDKRQCVFDEDCVSGDENTVEMRFVNLKNSTDICLMEAGFNKEVGEQDYD